MIELLDAVLELVEPGGAIDATTGQRTATSGVTVDHTAAEPFTFAPNTLYGWLTADDHDPAGVGNPPTDQERFALSLLFSTDSGDEEAKQVRTRAVSQALDDKGHAYLALLRANRSRYSNGTVAPWKHIAGAIDNDLIRDFEVRGIGLRVTGYRYIES